MILNIIRRQYPSSYIKYRANRSNTGIFIMKNEYDFSKSIQNPYAKHLKKQMTLRLGVDVIGYFKNLSEETRVPYQNLINLYLQDCA
jgi:uncharacterized protein (DUF4415 family)